MKVHNRLLSCPEPELPQSHPSKALPEVAITVLPQSHSQKSSLGWLELNDPNLPHPKSSWRWPKLNGPTQSPVAWINLVLIWKLIHLILTSCWSWEMYKLRVAESGKYWNRVAGS